MNDTNPSLARASIRQWHALDAETVLAELEATPDGLSEAEASARLERVGRNELPPAGGRSALRRLVEQFQNLLIYVLLAAGLITVALGHYTDAAVIFGVVVINAIIGFIQEGKAERALEAVRGMLARRAIVRRGSVRREIDAAGLVPGDIVLLAAGDRVPADLRILQNRNLRIDEAVLTGESVPVDKQSAPVAEPAPLAERLGMAYSGTVVTYGQATGVVVATGSRTEVGHIGALVSGVRALTTPLTRKLDQFARRITVFILVGCALSFAFGYTVHAFPVAEIFLAMVGLAVSAIPEGLPAVVTITLAIGTQRMARRNAIVRRLPAVETLGAVTVICTDKTGTLTRNEMTAVSVVTPERQFEVTGAGYVPEGGFNADGKAVVADAAHDLVTLARCALLCNDASLQRADDEWTLTGDPTEGALLTLALKAGLYPPDEQSNWVRVDEVPFESERRFMATLHHDHKRGNARIYLKGAPEQVLALCATTAGGNPVDRGFWEEKLRDAARAGQRVLALARRDFPIATGVLTLDDLRCGFELLGLVGMIDPPRPEAIEAVERCRAGGVGVKMITGDHALTAAAIGERLGLSGAEALNGTDIDALDDAALVSRLTRTDVIARASPEHKLRMVGVLQEQGNIVAMTGDGVNDAPALKRADIGVAMGQKGTDAARETADIVLTDDNFASIANAVAEGRTIFDNIKKSLLFILPTNGGEAGVILLAVFLGLALPVTAAQILWVNMVTTVTLAIALAFELPERGVMKRPPRPPAEPLVTRLLLGRITYVTLLMVGATFYVFQWELGRSGSLESARTAAVNMLVFGELVYLFNCRFFVASSLGSAGFQGNVVALWVGAALVALQLLFTYAPAMQQLFRVTSLDAYAWMLILGLSLAKFVAVEAEKAVLRRFGVVRL